MEKINKVVIFLGKKGQFMLAEATNFYYGVSYLCQELCDDVNNAVYACFVPQDAYVRGRADSQRFPNLVARKIVAIASILFGIIGASAVLYGTFIAAIYNNGFLGPWGYILLFGVSAGLTHGCMWLVYYGIGLNVNDQRANYQPVPQQEVELY